MVELPVQGSLHNPHVECYGVLDEDFNLRKVRLNAKHQDTETHPEVQIFKISPASDWLSIQPGDRGSWINRPPRDFGVEASSAAPGESKVCLCGRVMSKGNDRAINMQNKQTTLTMLSVMMTATRANNGSRAAENSSSLKLAKCQPLLAITSSLFGV